MKQLNIKSYVLLHALLMVYSLSGLMSKLASGQTFFSLRFFVYYCVSIFLMGVYAVCWQQIIKHLSLLTAFSSKAITVVWGMLWGAVLFQEKITLGKIVGAVFVLLGIVLFVRADGEASL